MVSVPLILFPTSCSNMPSSFSNECFQNFFVLFIFHNMSIINFRSTCCIYYVICYFFSFPGEDPPLNLYWPSVTPRPENRCVSYIFVKFDKMSIYSCWIMLDFFSRALFLAVIADVMVGAFSCVNPLLEMVYWFFALPLVVQDCPPLVVLSHLHFILVMSIPP